MKKSVLLLALLVVTVVGVIAYDQLRGRMLADSLQRQTTEIAQGYKAITDRDFPMLVASRSLTKTQTDAVHAVALQESHLTAPLSLADKVDAIHHIQTAIVSFLQDVTPDQPFAQSPSMTDLQKEMGKDGQMRPLLSAYNQTAKEWNSRQSGGLRTLTSDILHQKGDLLPYLRFDGQLEYFTVIHL